MTDERAPKFCPFCGGSDLTTFLVEWPALSAEDRDNVATLNEHQCGACGGASFWT